MSTEYLNGDNSIGKLEFGVQYLSDTHQLIVDILRIFDLHKESNQSTTMTMSNGNIQQVNNYNTEIYCKCTLLPDKQSFKTSLLKRVSDPIFEEKIEFEKVESGSLEHASLEIALYECDRNYSRSNECIGITYFRLNNQNIENKKVYLKDLRPNTSKLNDDENLGELMFSLAYLPAAERLTIVIMKARNLRTLGGLDKKISLPGKNISFIRRIYTEKK